MSSVGRSGGEAGDVDVVLDRPSLAGQRTIDRFLGRIVMTDPHGTGIGVERRDRNIVCGECGHAAEHQLVYERFGMALAGGVPCGADCEGTVRRRDRVRGVAL